MKAYITSIGEPTTELCVWSVERLGHEPVLVKGPNSLAEKLKHIYEDADDDFIRIDADVILTHNPQSEETTSTSVWWWQFATYNMYSFKLDYGGVQYITKTAIPHLREAIGNHLNDERPETTMWRLPALMKPVRRCFSIEKMVGIHGFGQKDIQRVKATKRRRNQSDFDWELVEKMQEFYK